MANNKDFIVKNGFKPTVFNEGVGTVTSAAGSYVIANATYAEKSKDVSADNDNPQGIWMREDNGTDFYMLGTGTGGDRIDQYLLSTAFDISTASVVAAKTLDVSPETSTDPTDLFFKPDGTKLYVCDQTGVYQYALSSAWDLSTASFETGKTVSISSQETANQAVAFSADGDKMFIVGSNQDTVFQYNLSTEWDVSTATYSNNSLDISGETSTPSSIRFSDDGKKVFISERTASAESILQYSMTTAYDVSTMSYDSVSLDVSAQEGNPQGLAFGDSGTKIYVVGSTSDTVFQYTSGTAATLDLSTGAVFNYTPTSNVEVKFTNPGETGIATQATVLLTGAEGTGVDSTFSTDLYTGTGSTQTVTTGVDLSTDGGITWIKNRGVGVDHTIWDTERTGRYRLESNTTAAQEDQGAVVWTPSTTGFSIGGDGGTQTFNTSSNNFVAWSFKKQAKFFDLITYTGNGSTQDVSHNLGGDVGMIFFRSTSAANWFVWHRGMGDDAYLFLNGQNPEQNPGFDWIDVTSTTISLQNNSTNTNGETFVGYLFGHNTASDSLIKSDIYTGNGSASGNAIYLGWEPQFVIIKNISATSDWVMFDNQRGAPIGDTSNDLYLFPNGTNSEGGGIPIDFTSTGFTVFDTSVRTNASGNQFVYTAVRDPLIPTITYDPAIEWAGGTAPTSPAEGETDVLTFTTTDGGSTYRGAQAIDGAQ